MSSPVHHPSDDDIRAGLVERVGQFVILTGRSRTEIGRKAVNDSAVIHRIATGGNFTLETYGRLMAWLDANWPECEAVE